MREFKCSWCGHWNLIPEKITVEGKTYKICRGCGHNLNWVVDEQKWAKKTREKIAKGEIEPNKKITDFLDSCEDLVRIEKSLSKMRFVFLIFIGFILSIIISVIWSVCKCYF